MGVAEEIQEAAQKVNEDRLFEAKRGSVGRHRSNHASRLGHPCLRALFYDRTAPEAKLPPSVRQAFIFKLGHVIERESRHELEGVGYKVVPPLQAYDYPEHNIVGSLDGILPLPSGTYPLEIKSVERHAWEQLIGLTDMTHSKKWWIRGYVAQVNLYCVLANYENGGVLWLKSKHTFEHRAIFVPLDLELAEECLQKAEAVNLHIDCKEPPGRMPFDASVCGLCDYAGTICSPPQPPRPRIDDADLIALLVERETAQEGAKRYKAIQDELKEIFPEEAVVFVGPFQVTVTQRKKGLHRNIKRLMEESPIG